MKIKCPYCDSEYLDQGTDERILCFICKKFMKLYEINSVKHGN